MECSKLRKEVICAGWFFAATIFMADAGEPVNVLQFHNHATRDGLYVDPAFTPAAAAMLQRDTNFDGAIAGNVYAQPLYLESGPGGRATVIAVTESNNIYALDAANGKVLWQQNAGAPVPLAHLPCGNIDPLGITGTPVADLSTRRVFFDAMTTPDGGTTKKHLIFALSIDTGAILTNWPVNVDANARSGGNIFNSGVQNQRGALAIVGNIVYVPYGGFSGDCGPYRGWVVGVPEDNPTNVQAWATTANRGGAWAVGGVSSDGTSPFVATGNTVFTTTWEGGEAVIRLQTGPVFSGLTNDYWAPPNWGYLDELDLDLGGSGVLLLDVPSAIPSALAVALGKDGNAYLLNRTNLGGVTVPVAEVHVSDSWIIETPAAYQTVDGSCVAFRATSGEVSALRIAATSPPGIASVWSVSQSGLGSPFVTSPDGTNSAIVWVIGSEGDQRLHGYDGDTGAEIFTGGGTNELMSGTRRFSSGIVAHGRIYVANDNQVYAFTVPVPPIILTNVTILPGGTFQFNFTNTPGLSFTVYSTTNLSISFANWMRQGTATEISPGQFRFSAISTDRQQSFYRVTSP